MWYRDDYDENDRLVEVTWYYSSPTQIFGFIRGEGQEVYRALSGLGTWDKYRNLNFYESGRWVELPICSWWYDDVMMVTTMTDLYK